MLIVNFAAFLVKCERAASFLIENRQESSPRVNGDRGPIPLLPETIQSDVGKLIMGDMARELQEEGSDATPDHLIWWADLHLNMPELVRYHRYY